MRKLLLVLFTALIIVPDSFGQLSIGVVGFPQISNLTNKYIRKDPIIDNKLSFGGGGGITVTYGFSERFGLQLGAFYSSQNQKINSTYTLSGVEYTSESKKRFTYLKIPLLLRVSRPVGRMTAVIFAGPQFSYLMKYDGGMIVYIEDQYYDLPPTPSGNDFYNKYTIDATGGAGLEYPIMPYVDLTASVKVDYNITNAENKNATINGMKVSDINGSGSAPARNMTYALLLGLNFKFRNPNDLISPTNKFRGKSYGKKRRF